MPFDLPSRQIHLDFHTGPAVPDVGRDFDAREFARTMKAANVNSVTVFAKCHHGHLYYATKRPERHPGLKPGLDLLGEQVEALHREGIRAPIYISVQCDEYAANTHPEWMVRNQDGSTVGCKHLQSPQPFFQWQIVDMNSDYQEYLAEQTAEILKRFKPVDGIFFDMCWDQASCSHAAVRAMVKAGRNPEREEDRRIHGHAVAIAYMKRFHAQVKASSREASVYFNSRPLHNLAEELPYLHQVEIEALPTGGWGYLYFPKNVRFARTFGRQYMGMTARFHRSWGDFGGLKPAAALEYETAQMLAHGARCSVGDQLHPRGTLDRGAYDLIGRTYARVAAREAWCFDTTSVADVGLFQVPQRADIGAQVTAPVDEGATRLLTQIKAQFDVVTATSDLAAYRVLVLPDAIPVDAALAKRLTAFARAGGSVLLTGSSGLAADSLTQALPAGVAVEGPSPFEKVFWRFTDGIDREVPPSDHVFYERGLRLRPGKGTTALGRVVEPYFERAWDHFVGHCQTPGATLSTYPLATVAQVGKGRIAWIPFPVFGAYATYGNVPIRLLVRNVLDRLLPEPVLRLTAPTSTEATVMRQAAGDDRPARTVVHLLQYCPERRAKDLDLVEDVVPIHNIPFSLTLAKAPKRVYLAPEDTDLPFTWKNGRVAVTVPEVNGHAMVVCEG